eukprot:766126-Hanusia_phi.AAC.2
MGVAYQVFEGINRELDKAIAFGKENRSVTFRADATTDQMTTLGLVVGERAGIQCTVLDFIPGSPAYLNDKIRKGDIIRRVNDVDASAANIEELLRGSDIPGTTVGLLIERKSRKRPFDVNLTRAPVAFVESKSKVHEKLQELAHAASTKGEEAPGECDSLLRDIQKQIDAIDREYMEKEHVLIGEIEYKIECLKAVQHHLFEWLMTFKDIDLHLSAPDSSKPTTQDSSPDETKNTVGAGGPWQTESILHLQKELEQANNRTEQVLQLLSEATEGREETVDEAASLELARLEEITQDKKSSEAALKAEINHFTNRFKEESEYQLLVQEELERFDLKVAKLEDYLEQIRSEMQRHTDTGARARDQAVTQQKELERLNAELQSLLCLKQQNIQLDSEVMSRDITISELETCLRQLETEIADLKVSLPLTTASLIACQHANSSAPISATAKESQTESHVLAAANERVEDTER